MHPFRAVVEAGDLLAVPALLAPEVTFLSPVAFAPYTGRELVAAILRGAFRQGLMLMHGCKEGQCSACKSFLLDGEVDLEKYSTFALNDYEKEEGWTLLCRAHAETDLEVELINYDEEVLRSGIALSTQQMRVEKIEALTHDIQRSY